MSDCEGCVYCELKSSLKYMAGQARQAGDQAALDQINFRQLVLEEIGKLRFDLIFPVIEEFIGESNGAPRCTVQYELDMQAAATTLIKL